MILLLGGDAGVGDGVEDQLLEVGDIKVPREVDVKIVESYTFVAHEAWVIRRNRDWNALMKEGTGWMASKIEHVPKNEVRNGATFDADLLFFHDFLQFGVIREMESVADSFGIQQDGVVELEIVSIRTLAAVEINRELNTHGSSFCTGRVNLWQKLVDLRREVLLIDHVESDHHVRVLFALEECVDLALDVVLAHNLEAASDDFHLEEWVHILNLLLDT